MMGAAFGAGEQGYNIGRNAALLAGIDVHVPGCTVNRFCASSLQTIRMAVPRDHRPARATSTSLPASRPSRGRPAARTSSSTRGSTAPTGAICDVYIPMGLTAENVAERYGVYPRGAGRLGA